MTKLPAIHRTAQSVAGWLPRVAGWVKSCLKPATAHFVATELESPFAEHVLWVKDAPLFIDEINLAQFYDASLRPPFDDAAPVKLKLTESVKNELAGKLAGKGTAGIANWLSWIAASSVELSAEGQLSRSRTDGSEAEIVLQPIKTPHRQLEQLTIFYALRNPDQLLFGTPKDVLSWQENALSVSVPRPLVFIDLPKGTKFIPMAAEFAERHTSETFYDKLRGADGSVPPKFGTVDKLIYWKWFDDNFDADAALKVVEEAASTHGRVEWVDFRVPLDDKGHTMHVHIEAAGKYSTGTFGYRLIRRALGHGMRIVGTLRDGPDVNVLALYEK